MEAVQLRAALADGGGAGGLDAIAGVAPRGAGINGAGVADGNAVDLVIVCGAFRDDGALAEIDPGTIVEERLHTFDANRIAARPADAVGPPAPHRPVQDRRIPSEDKDAGR